ncbi:maleylpyruvate isomerase family mycothiol-dependent enzyme [Nocardioides sp. GY 10127]|uniref:maleylpyruvate isomerase family mycothiol-dependent enzyme n=1 Tax=Nocardioides sp. GY 10127 TaxID=2569762 RepID=UPI001458BBC2|nr:maleylpyruvate isomerase family mycothiol-dependent enzyme [Nocardioides sp. GY 10127]
MDAEQTWSAVARERRHVADVVERLSPAEWDTPSLCGRWTVGQVAVHLTVPLTHSLGDVLGAMARRWFSYDRAMDHLVRQEEATLDAERGPGVVATRLREGCGKRFAPPGLGPVAPLTDLRIHLHDMAVPLGLEDASDPAAWPAVLDFLVSPAARLGFFTRPKRPSVTLVATDLDWTHGQGPRVEGPAARLGLALAGRSRGLDPCEGPGVPLLREWIAR